MTNDENLDLQEILMKSYIDSYDHQGVVYKIKDYDLIHPSKDDNGKVLTVTIDDNGEASTAFLDVINQERIEELAKETLSDLNNKVGYIKVIDILQSELDFATYDTEPLLDGDKIEVLSNYENKNTIYSWNKKEEKWEIFAERSIQAEKIQELEDKFNNYMLSTEIDETYEKISEVDRKLNVLKENLESSITSAVNDTMTKIVDGAPENLNSFKELVDQIQKDQSGAADMLVSIGENTRRIEALATVAKTGNYSDLVDTPDLDIYATKNQLPTKVSQLENDTGYLTDVPSEYITESELDSKGYLTSIPAEYITEDELNQKGYLTSIPSEYITETELDQKGYLTEHQDISHKLDSSIAEATYLKINNASATYETKTDATQKLKDAKAYSDKLIVDIIDGAPEKLNTFKELADYVASDETATNAMLESINENKNKIQEIDDSLSAVATSGSYTDLVNTPDLTVFATQTQIPTKVSQLTNDSKYLTSIPAEYITESELNSKGYLTEHQDISGKLDTIEAEKTYAKKTELDNLVVEETDPTVPNYVKLITQENIVKWNSAITEVDVDLDEASNNPISNSIVTQHINALQTKQDKLIEGSGINISDDNIISANIDLSGYVKTDYSASTLAVNENKLRLRNSKGDNLLNQDAIEFKTINGQSIFGEGNLVIQGGGGTSSENVTLTSLSPDEIVISLGQAVTLSFDWSSKIEGNGMLYVYVNNILRTTKMTKQGSDSVEITDYLTSANEYTIRLTVEDSVGSKRSLTYSVNVISLSITSKFDQTQVQKETVNYRYTPYGNMEKTIHYFLDGTENTTTVTESGREQILEFNNLTHGKHTLKVYSSVTIDDTIIKSNALEYKFAYSDEVSSDPIIVIYNNNSDRYSNGQVVPLNFLVYNKDSITTDIVVSVNGTEQNLTVGRKLQTLNISNYVVGNNTITISSGSISDSFTFIVDESEIKVTPVTTGLRLFLSSNNKNNSYDDRDVWSYTYNDNTTYNTTFTDFTWVDGVDGWVNDDDGLTALKLTANAKISIDCKPFDNDPKANGKVIELEFMTSKVTDYETEVINIMTEDKGILIKPNVMIFKSSGQNIQVKFKEEEHIRVSLVIEADGFIKTYLNGVLCGVDVFSSSDAFQQTNPVNITAGSELCDLYLYKIRIYENDLTAYNILDNYIADNDSYDKKLYLYTRNNIHDTYGNILYNYVREVMPVFIITAPILPSTKDEEQPCSVELENCFNQTLNFVRNDIIMKPQGTSSLEYPYKNFEFLFNDTDIQLYPDAILENRLTLKADFASSAGVFNMGNAKIVNEIYQEKNPRQADDERVRNSLYGYPVAVFYRPTINDDLQFYYKGSLNLSKKAKALGYQPGDESWSVEDNISPLCLFKTNDYENNDISKAFDARYNENEDHYKNLKLLIDWVVSCTGDPEKFAKECEDHFNLHYLLLYYIYGMVMGGADSFAKNMYLTYFAQTERWYPQFYDLDTTFGIDNSGKLAFEYSSEFSDMNGDAHIFNGATSVLWNLVEQAFATEIAELYEDLRTKNIITYEGIMSVLYDDGIKYYPESIYNEDARIKYLDTHMADGKNSYLSTCLGSTYEHLKYWVNNRLAYLDSMWSVGSYVSDRISLRITTPSWSSKNYNIKLTSKDDTYLKIQYGTNYYARVRANRNVEYTMVPDLPDDSDVNDTESYIYGAKSITKIGDLKDLYLAKINIQSATNLAELKVGDSSSSYQNTSLKEFTCGSNKLLRKIDLRNCTALTDTISVKYCENLKEIYTSGTALTNIEFPNGGNLNIIDLPDTMNIFVLQNQNKVETINTTGLFEKIVVENCNFDTLEYVKKSVAAGKLNRIRIIGVDWLLENSDLLETLMTLQGVDDAGLDKSTSVLVGHVHVRNLSENQYNRYKAYWGEDLEITHDGEYLPEFNVYFKNWDGTVLETKSVMSGRKTSYTGETPTRPDDEDKTYTFGGWDQDPKYTTITAETTFTAVYNYKVIYTVTWIDWDGTVLYQTKAFKNTNLTYPYETPTRDNDVQYKDYEFTGWSNSTSNIVANVTTVAQYSGTIQTYLVYFYNGDDIIATQEIEYNKYPTWTNELPEKDGYSFYGWSFDKDSIEGLNRFDINLTSFKIDSNVVSNEGQIVKIYAVFGDLDGVCFKFLIPSDADFTSSLVTLRIPIYEPKSSYVPETILIDWGDGVAETVDVSSSSVNRIFSFSHTTENYQRDVEYEIKVIKKGDFIIGSVNNSSNKFLIENIDMYLTEFTFNTEFYGSYDNSFICEGLNRIRKLNIGHIATYFSNLNFGANKPFYLKEISVDERNKHLISIDNVLYTKDLKSVIIYPRSKEDESYSILEGTENIRAYCFYNTYYLKNLYIPNTLIAYNYRYSIYCRSSDYSNKINNIFLNNTLSDYCQNIQHSVDGSMTDSSTIDNFYYKDSNDEYVLLSGALNIPTDITKINLYSFSGCDTITSLYVPENIETIGGRAFEYCSELLNVEIKAKIPRISDHCFFDCTKIENFYLPGTIEKIDLQGFENLRSLKNVYFDGSLDNFLKMDVSYKMYDDYTYPYGILTDSSSQDAKLYIKNSDNEYELVTSVTITSEHNYTGSLSGYRGLKSVIIDNSVTSLFAYSFYLNKGLESITLSENLQTINKGCFYGCEKLNNVVLPNTVTTIKDSAFSSCKSLESLIIPDSITTIPYQLCYGCNSLTSFTIGSSVTSIGSQALYTTKATPLVIKSKPETPPTITTNTFSSSYFTSANGCSIIVPTETAVANYQSATNWTSYSDIITQGVIE